MEHRMASPDHNSERSRVIADVARTLAFLTEPGSVFEIRALGKGKRVTAGYFRDPALAAQQVVQVLDGRMKGVYVTLNPVIEGAHARAHDRLEPFPEGLTKDAEITRRRWLLVDCDPHRDPKDISSTDAEHQAAIDRAEAIHTFLREQGWAEPISADTGNGAALLFAIDLPNAAESDQLVARVLKTLANRFNDAAVTIDPSVDNAARLCKLLGTWAKKGDSTPARPHRRSRLLSVSEGGRQVVMAERLTALCDQFGPPPAAPKPSRQSDQNRAHGPGWIEDVEAYLPQRRISFRRKREDDTAQRTWELERCVWREHSDPWKAWVIQNAVTGVISAGCQSDDCQDKGINDLRDKVEPGWRAKADKAERGPSIAVQLVALAGDCDFFHDGDREAWVTFSVGEHKETTRVNAGAFWDWLERRFHESTGRTANAAAKQEAQGVFRGKAKYEGSQHSVHVRIAEHDGAIYLDLADAERRVVRITSTAWQVVGDAPVKFWRPKGLLPLPMPTKDTGTIDDLRAFVNVTKEEWPLLVGFILGCLRAAAVGGHPVLAIGGEQGSAKSTLARIIRLLVDPNRAPLRSEPSDKRDLAIAAQNCRLLALDNLSGTMQNWLSDSLCRISTGGGHATRQLYSDADEVIFDFTRPLLLTSIADVASKSDLVDRTIFLSLPRITEDKRRAEGTFWPAFEQKRAGILGALLDAVVVASRRLPNTSVARLPRMADFAKWVIAAEPALGWEAETFLNAYRDNRAAANNLALDSSLVAQAILELVKVGSSFTGTSKALLAALNKRHPENDKKPGWPQNPRGMSGAIRTIAPNLRAEGFDIPEEPRKAHHGNVWTISRSPLEKEETPPPPPPSASPEPSNTGFVAVEVEVEVDVHAGQNTSTPTSTHASPRNNGTGGLNGGGGGAVPFISNGHHQPPERTCFHCGTACWQWTGDRWASGCLEVPA
jgi:hypothetical protein